MRQNAHSAISGISVSENHPCEKSGSVWPPIDPTWSSWCRHTARTWYNKKN